ncbi:SPOR domain-containing protein [Clostridioides sp. ZZV14-6009]|uniref:SPOR domain-containing protein n=1 Tax=Clostridioides sp. ZZV14-6048 TaxID=2811490 RepID=UPI001D10E25A|nr:SPOR domain-containing protein [Clostridioides sp. ZZV14-6105]MCC0728622.1 SPOR domain-containing protein [Clostridioides sp. ZZV14-6045]MCC0732779.1 SPOR domain-containing protein [Clostridioides sp. ZZV14-6048]MCC0736762.1 SPOR domain-containing protein [Clostridioides sp. ZZV14-6009]
MKVLSENNIIRNTVLNVTASFLKQESKINEKLEGVLEKKFEKVEFNEAKYAELLKFNILFYKTLARNTEPLIGKWIVDKYIPEIDELEKDLELTTAKCRKYVNKAMKDGLDCLKANDLSSFLAYDKMDLSERRRRLEKDYKVLNLYKDLLNITLRKISLEKKDCASLFLKNQADAKRELKREIIFCVNKILASSKEVVPKNIEESSEQSSEDIKATEIEDLQLGKDNSENDVLLNSVKKSELGKEPQINDVEAKFMDKLNSLNDESISQTVYNEYKKLCGLEELPYVEGYGFGREVIKDFVCATVALEFLKRRNRDLIEGAMRLTIIGEFGAENFKEFIDYVIKNKTEISENVWEEAHVVLKDKSSELENHDIVSKRARKNKDIDIEEYIYMIKNADKDVCFRSSISIEEDTKEEDAKEDVINKNDNIENVLENKENIEKEHDVNEEEIIESENKKSRKKDKLFGFMKKESKKEDVVEVTEKEEISLGNTSDAVTDEPNEFIKDNIENLEEVNQSLEEERSIKIEKPINNNELDKKLSASNEPKSEKESKGLGDEISKEAEEKKVESEKSVVIPINKKEKNSKKSKHSPKSNSKEKKTEIKNYESNEEDFIDDEEVGSKKSRLKETIIAIVIVAIVGVGYFITVGNNKKNDKDSTPQKASTQQQANNKQTEEEKKAKAEKEKKAKAEKEKKEAEDKAKAEEKEKAEKKAKEMEAYKDGKGVYYTVYAGSLKVEATAKETAKEYEAKGISSTIVQENGYYKVKIGDYSEYGEAQEKCNELAKKSIDTYIAMYDKYYDYKLEDLKESAPSLSAEELRQKYEDLRSELRNKSGYREYVKHLDKLYEEIVEGA